MTWNVIEAGELMARRGGSVNPIDFPDETFELYSIPAFDRGSPDLARGSEIGSAKPLVEPNDVMISRIVPHIRRATVVGPKKDHRQIASTEWIVFRDPRIYPHYLRHYLVSDRFNVQFMSTVAGVGGSLLRARPIAVSKIEIPLPPLAEQRRIAGLLDAADELRAQRRESLAQLDTLLQATFLDLFGDPITNPKGWQKVRLESLGTLDRGASKHRPRNEPSLLGGPYPLVQTGDVANSGGYIRGYSSTYSEKGLKQSKMWPAGTLCITIAANIANTGILTFDSCFPDSVVGFKSKVSGRVEYVQGLFWFLRKILEQQATQVAQKNINLRMLREIEVPKPSQALEERFVCFTKGVEQLKEQQRKHLAELDTLFASLQSRAFQGEL